ncbi:MAG: SMC-Scp complex subunit ScpB [Patescibacteria group bacterium]
MTSNLIGQLEGILFAAAKPLLIKKLAEITESDQEKINKALAELSQRFGIDSGLNIVRHGQEVELVTNPEHTKLIRAFLKKEELGELTRPQLEALSVIAYRGPLAKSELEQIRGVNCSLILRNLQIRGLVEQLDNGVVTIYQVTVDFVRFLGLTDIKKLPDYERLHTPKSLEQLLEPKTAVTETVIESPNIE